MVTDSMLRRQVAGAALFAFLALATPALAGERYIEVCPEDEDCAECVRPPLGYAICRHLKLQSVYTWRKVTRPYRRIATVPPEMAPYVAPSLPPNAYTNPFGPSPVEGYTGSFGSATDFPPPGHAIRYNYGPSAGSPGPAVIQYR